MGSTGDVGRDEGRMKLAFWGSTKDKIVNWVLGVQGDQVRSVGCLPQFPSRCGLCFSQRWDFTISSSWKTKPSRQGLRNQGSEGRLCLAVCVEASPVTSLQ